MNLSELMNQVLLVLPIPLFCTFKDFQNKKLGRGMLSLERKSCSPTAGMKLWNAQSVHQGTHRTGFPLASESSLKIWCAGWRSGGTAVSGCAKGQWHQRTWAPSKNHKYEWKIEDGSWNNRTQGWKISTEIQKALEDWTLSFLTHKYFGPILFCL